LKDGQILLDGGGWDIPERVNKVFIAMCKSLNFIGPEISATILLTALNLPPGKEWLQDGFSRWFPTERLCDGRLH